MNWESIFYIAAGWYLGTILELLLRPITWYFRRWFFRFVNLPDDFNGFMVVAPGVRGVLIFTPAEEGGYIVSDPNDVRVLTQAETLEEAFENVADVKELLR